MAEIWLYGNRDRSKVGFAVSSTEISGGFPGLSETALEAVREYCNPLSRHRGTAHPEIVLFGRKGEGK